MRDGDHRDAHILIQVVDGLHYLLAAPRVQHGGGLVQDQAVGPHSDHARNGDALLLAAGEVVRSALPVLVDARHLHGVVHAAAHLFGRDAEVFQRKGDIFLHHGGDDLVVRALEHHADLLADIVNFVLVLGVHPLHHHGAAFGQKDGVEVLGQGGFAAAVRAQNGHELAAPDPHRYAVQGVDRLFRVVAKFQIIRCQDRFFHLCFLFPVVRLPKRLYPILRTPSVCFAASPLGEGAFLPPSQREVVSQSDAGRS